MKLIKRILAWLIGVILLLVVLLYVFDYEYILKGARVVYMTGHTTAYIDDYPHFYNQQINKSSTPVSWPLHKNYNSVQSTEKLNKTNKKYGTVALMIIKNDSIWYEKYAEGYGTASKTNSFSMAKSIVTAMLGKAIMDGYIKSLSQPIGDFLPEFSDGMAGSITVGDLSSMSSGLDWVEHYTSPFSITAKAYYDSNIREVCWAW